VLKIYSIKEIVEASNKLIVESQKVNEELIIDSKKINNELIINSSNSTKEKYSSDKAIPKDIENIILAAENSQIQNIKNNPTKISNQEKKNAFEDFKVSKDELIESMYKTFSKKIKKNTLKLVLELREEVIFLTKKISSIEKLREQEQYNNDISKKDIVDLVDLKSEIKKELEKSQVGFNHLKDQYKNLDVEHDSLKDQHKNLDVEHDSLKDQHKNLNAENSSLKKNLSNLRIILIQLMNQTVLLKNNHMKINLQLNDYKNNELVSKPKIEKFDKDNIHNRSLEINNHELKNTVGRYIKKNKELQNEINELKNSSIKVTNNNDYSANIRELENKVKHYQDENIRISNEFVESNKKYEITRESLNELQKHKSDLIEKIKSINEVIKNDNIVTSVFKSDLEEDKINEIDSNKPTKKKTSDLDDKIKDIFAKN